MAFCDHGSPCLPFWSMFTVFVWNLASMFVIFRRVVIGFSYKPNQSSNYHALKGAFPFGVVENWVVEYWVFKINVIVRCVKNVCHLLHVLSRNTSPNAQVVARHLVNCTCCRASPCQLHVQSHDLLVTWPAVTRLPRDSWGLWFCLILKCMWDCFGGK